MLLTFTACDATPKIESLEQKLKDTNAKISALQTELDVQKARIDEIAVHQIFDEDERLNGKMAFLTPGSSGYSVIRFKLGVLIVRFIDVKPFANGSKVTLEFGNTLAVSVTELKVTLDYGKVGDKGFPLSGEIKTKEMTFVETLNSGAWTKVTVVLDGVPPTDLGFVSVKNVSHSGVKLLAE